MRWDNANALWAICAPTAAPTDYGRKPGPPIHPIHNLVLQPGCRRLGLFCWKQLSAKLLQRYKLLL